MAAIRHENGVQPDLGQELHYLDGGWRTLPGWAAFFVAIGSAIATAPSDSPRLVAAVSVPTRAFAAALCASGAVFACARRAVVHDSAAHLAYLRTLPPGTTVDYRHGAGGAYRSTGWLAGFEKHYNQDYIVIHDTCRSTLKIMASNAHHVEPAAKALPKLPTRRRPSIDVARLGLVVGALGREEGYVFARDSRLECLLVGNKGTLYREIIEADFAVERDGRWARGRLQDLLRVRAFLDDANGHRSEVVPVGAKLVPTLNDATPRVVVFDGATSFLRWHATWPGANWLIVLDRTERRFADAVASLDGMYATRRPDNPRLTTLLPPPSLEWSVFAMRRGSK